MIDIKLPRPHAQQQYILDNASKRNVICAGRRGGKTTLLSGMAVRAFLDGRRVLYGAPTADQTDVFWSKCQNYLQPLIDNKYLYKNESKQIITWMHEKNGHARIKAKTAWNADTWRGDSGDLLIFDEYAKTDPDAWELVGAPMCLDTDGDAWFISTPNRKNHFFALHTRGKDELTERWRSFHFTSHDNPHLSEVALRELTEDMTEDGFKQEILAQFLENEGAVFRNVGAAHCAPVTTPEQHAGHFLVAGIDWGKRQDYTVISIVCADCRQEVSLTRFNKIDYTYQRQRLTDDIRLWDVQAGLAELNAMGEPNLELLQADDLPIAGFWTTASSKPPLIENLVRVVERCEYQFLPHTIAQAEMEAYEVKISPTTNRATYGAPDGVNDDTVIGRALATWQAQRHIPALL